MCEQRTSYSAPARNVSSGVLICVCFVSAGKTPKLRLAFPIALVYVPAFRALAAGVSRVNDFARNPSSLGLVLHEGAKLAERPVVQTFPLLFSGLNLASYVRQVFQLNAKPGAFRSGYDALGNNVILMLLEPALPATQLAQTTLGGLGSHFLKDGTTLDRMLSVRFYLRSRVLIAQTVRGDIHDTQVHAKHAHRGKQAGIFKVTHASDVPVPTHEHEVDLALTMLKQLALMVAANERDFRPSTEQPDRNRVLCHKAKDTVVVGLSSMGAEFALRIFAGLVGIGNLCNAAHGYLSGKLEARAKFGIKQLVHVELAGSLYRERLLRKPVTGFVCSLKRGAKQCLLVLSRLQLDVGY